MYISKKFLVIPLIVLSLVANFFYTNKAHALCPFPGEENPAEINSITVSPSSPITSPGSLTVDVDFRAGAICTGFAENIAWDAVVAVDDSGTGISRSQSFSGSGPGWQSINYTTSFTISAVPNGPYTIVVSVDSSHGNALPQNRSYTINRPVLTGTISVSSNVATTWGIAGPTPQSQSSPVTSRTYNSEEAGIYTIIADDVAGYGPAQIRVNGTLLGMGTASFTLTAGSTAGVSFTYVVIPVACGNGALDAGESCDNGASNGACPATCSTSCTTNICSGGTHNVCVGNTCRVVSGPGSDQCNPPGSLCGATHNACIDPGTGPRCTLVPGAGANECAGLGTLCSFPGGECTIVAVPSLIYRYQYSTLTWSCDASLSACSIDQGIGAVPVNGSIQISPIQKTVYTITCNGGGSASAQATVNVVKIIEDNPHP